MVPLLALVLCIADCLSYYYMFALHFIIIILATDKATLAVWFVDSNDLDIE
jgi:hypothetical protein